MRNKKKRAVRTGVKRDYKDLGYDSPGEMFRAWMQAEAERTTFVHPDGTTSSLKDFEREGDAHMFDGDSKWPEPENPVDRMRRTKRTGSKAGKKSRQEKSLPKARRKI